MRRFEQSSRRLRRSLRRNWRRSWLSNLRRSRRSKPSTLRFGSRRRPRAPRPARSPEAPSTLRKLRRKRGRDCAFLTVQHRKNCRGVRPVRRVLLTDGADRRMSDRAEQRLRRGLRSAGKLAQRARKAREAASAEKAAQERAAFVQEPGVAAGDRAAELRQNIRIGHWRRRRTPSERLQAQPPLCRARRGLPGPLQRQASAPPLH